jgi:hypothetical protein
LEFTDTQIFYNIPGEQTTQIPNPKYSSVASTGMEYLIVASAVSVKINLLGFVQNVNGLNIADIQGNPPIHGAKYSAYCSDGMSNKLYPYTIHIFINNQPYTGCCHSQSHPAVGEP